MEERVHAFISSAVKVVKQFHVSAALARVRTPYVGQE